MNALRSLVASLVDYAGLFPPSSLPMIKAVKNYLRYRSSPEGWMLARFIVPVARLDEFEEAMAGQAPVPVNALAGPDLDRDLRRIASASMKIDTIEIKAPDDRAIDSAMERAGGRYTAYFEISDPDKIVVVRKKGGRVKIRMGGVTPEAFPSPEHAARLLETLGRTGTPFKATAGLHHPLRSYRPLTYSADGPSGWMFGFLNVFLAAVFARKGAPAGELAELLGEESLRNIAFEDNRVAWRGHAATEREIGAARRDFAISFGSCSFEEPVGDLRALGLLS